MKEIIERIENCCNTQEYDVLRQELNTDFEYYSNSPFDAQVIRYRIATTIGEYIARIVSKTDKWGKHWLLVILDMFETSNNTSMNHVKEILYENNRTNDDIETQELFIALIVPHFNSEIKTRIYTEIQQLINAATMKRQALLYDVVMLSLLLERFDNF